MNIDNKSMVIAGRYQITTENRQGYSVICNQLAEGLCKTARIIFHDGEPILYMVQLGGGAVEGDVYDASFRIGSSSSLLVTTQSSSKIYKTKLHPIQQHYKVQLDDQAILEFILDPFIAYEDARYLQVSEIQMCANSSLFWADSMTSGWSPSGELFMYHHIRTKLHIEMDGRMIVYDHLCLEGGSIKKRPLPEPFTHYGSIIILDSRIDQAWINALYEQLELDTSHFPNGSVLIGVSSLCVPSCIIRIMGCRSEHLHSVITAAHHIFRQLTGRASITLRK